MLETVAEKKIPPPLPPKTRRGCMKSGDGGGATIMSNGHVVKIRIDPMMMGDKGGGGGGGQRDNEPRREHAVGHRSSSTVKINITCVDPFVFRRHYDDADDDEDEDRRSVSSGHQSPLDSGTGSDLDTGSRRDESDDGTCSCDSLSSSTGTAADAETTVAVAAAADPPAAVAAAVEPAAPDAVEPAAPAAAVDATAAGVVATASVATVVEELPKRPPPAVHVQQRCYGEVAAPAAVRVFDMDNTDQYYSFHMNENVFDEVDAAAAASAAAAAAPADDSFAGCKTTAADASDAIRSAKGTIRGVKNRVRAGIATFLQPKTNKVRAKSRLIVLYVSAGDIIYTENCL